jgi:hypothetical protein
MSTQKTFAAGERVNLGEEPPPKAAPLKTNTQKQMPESERPRHHRQCSIFSLDSLKHDARSGEKRKPQRSEDTQRSRARAPGRCHPPKTHHRPDS